LSADGKKKPSMEAIVAYVTIINMMTLPQELLQHIFSYLCAGTLIQMKQVNKVWKELCTAAIDSKMPLGTRKAFRTNEELKKAVRKYNLEKISDVEEFATSYGYPINTWNVSKLKDFSRVFFQQFYFDEDISGWNVSNATSMRCMFFHAREFNQDISSWNVSNVTNMGTVFCDSRSFNQDLSSWNVSNVTDMNHMFCHAYEFNQDISCWNISNVKSMNRMFSHTKNFKQNLSYWNVSNITDMDCMFWQSLMHRLE